MDELKSYVEKLGLEDPSTAFPVAKAAERGLEASADSKESYVAAKTIVSFVSGVSLGARQDVLDSMLLAQLAANKAHPKEEDILKWYVKFIEVISTIGWVVEGKEIQTFHSEKDVYEVSDAIIGILTAAFGGAIIPVVTATLTAIKSLANNKHKIIAFEKNTHSQKKGAFQIAVAVENNNAVAVQLGTFLISATQEIRQILFFSSDKDSTALQYYSKKITLNADTYARVRETVKKRIAEKVDDFVAKIEL